MAGERVVNFGDYEITAKPRACYHKILWDIFPYWQASVQKFDITFKTTCDVPSMRVYNIYLKYQNDEMEHLGNFKFEHNKEGKIIRKTVITESMAHTGDAFLIVRRAGSLPDRILYSVHITNRSWFALAIVAGVFAGIFAALGNAIC